MDLRGAAAKRAGTAGLLVVCAGVGVAIAGLPHDVPSGRAIRIEADSGTSSSASTPTTAPGTTVPGPVTTSPTSTTSRRGTTTTAGRPAPRPATTVKTVAPTTRPTTPPSTSPPTTGGPPPTT